MKKRILATLLTLCMVLTLLPVMIPAAKAADTGVWVNGVDLSAGIATNCGSGTATYNAGTKTLTLKNATITVTRTPSGSSFGRAILVDSPTDPLTIQLEGDSSISSGQEFTYGIELEGNLTISGDGSLTIAESDPVESGGHIQIDNTVSLNLTSTTKDDAIYANEGITFGTVPYNGLHSKIIYDRGELSFPLSTLYVNNVNMLDGGATKPQGVTFDASTTTLTLNGAAITAAYSFEGDNYGIYADSNLTIHLAGTNTVGSIETGTYVWGDTNFTGNGSLTANTAYDPISSKGTLTVNSGVTISATTTNDNAIICQGEPTMAIVIKNGAVVTTSSPDAGLYAGSRGGSSTITIEKGAKVKVTTTGNDPDRTALNAEDSITIGGVSYRGTHKDMDYDGVHFPFPPNMTSLSPSGTGNPTSGNIVVTFDTAMNTSKGAVSLNALSALTGGSWSNGDKTYTIPYSGLAVNTPYTVKLEGFEGGIGNLFPTNTEKSFTTTNKAVVDGSITLTTLSKPYTGAALDFPATLTSVTPSGTPIWTYTYTPLDGDLLGAGEKPVDAGTYTVAVTYEDDANTGRKTFNIEVTPIDYTLTVVTTDRKNTYTYGDVIPFKVTADPTDAITSGSSVDFKFGEIDAGMAFVVNDNAIAHDFATAGDDVVPGTYTVTATKSAMGNYKEATATLPLTLNAKPLTATATKVYDGTANFTGAALTLDGIISSDEVTATASFTAENANAGEHIVATPAVTLAGARSAYYAAPAAVTATITAKTVSAPTIIADPATYVYTGSAITPTNVVVKDGLATIPAAEYTLSYSNNTAAGQAVITVTDVAGGNYNVSGTGHFTITAKTAVTVNMDGIALANKTYDGTALAYTGAAAGTYGESTPYAGGFTYEWYKGSEKLTEAPKAAGSYTLKAIVADRSYAGEGSKAVTITPKPLTITAENKEMLIGETEPAYTATNSALANGETISGVTFTVTGKNTAQKGVYAIVPAGGTITGGNANYTISYESGALTVTVDVTAIDSAITAANLEKTGITMSEGEPSSVENGTKFVKAAEMKALTDAIKTAADAKTTVGNAQQAADAVTALNTAVADFKKAIKTGTYVPSDDDDTTPAPPTSKPELPKTDPATGNTEVSVPVKSVTNGGTSSATVSEKAVSDAIAAAEKEAAKTGGRASVTVFVDAPKGAKTVETTLSGKSLSAVANGKTESLKISTPVAELSFDSEALKNIAGMAGKDVKISAAQVDTKALTDTQKSQVGEAPVFDFTVTSGGKTISDFGGGTATVSVPYTPKDGENPAFVTVWLLDDAGKLVPLEASYKDGRISFETGHFSRYAIGYLPFTDVDGHWAYESIVYAYQNKLFSGVGENKFAPADNMSRAMLWSALYRMAGSPDKTENPATWYADAQKWAIAENISDGTNPDGNVTREQLATILFRCKKAAAAAADMSSFADTADISAFAADGMSWAVANGILNGSGGKLNPQGNASRAEVAAMLQRFAAIGK